MKNNAKQSPAGVLSGSGLCSLGAIKLAAIAALLPALLAWIPPLQAGVLHVPNGSFESPATDFASPLMDAWQSAPQPGWYNDTNYAWSQLTGQFLNPATGAPNRIDNMNGQQGAYLFALPGVALFQDYTTGPAAGGRFNAQFEAGKSYTLTVGVVGGGGGMSNGATLEIAFYFRDVTGKMVTVRTTTITNSQTLFPTNTHLTDFQVRLPVVNASDAWAGKRIGIRLESTVGFGLLGGYWDIDNVRVTESVVPNHSFESPPTDFASPLMEAWQTAPQPGWYTDTNFPWFQLTGQFLNPSNGAPNHIDNMEGQQGAFLFALPDVAIFQDLTPSPAAAVKFEAGKSYTLTVGVLGGGGGMSNGATFEISLYYRDATSNRVPVAATSITNSPTLFPTNSHFTDFIVRVPPVKTNDAWAGKPIGIRLASTTSFLLMGGYWDIDDVRLTESVLPNHSFESPETDFASPLMDAWQMAPQPFWYMDTNYPWFQLTGQFLNPSNGAPNRIDNLEGQQGAFLFALPDVAIFQDSLAGGGTPPDFKLRYEPGNTYSLTVGVLGGGGGMSNGATLAIRFYYRDAASNQVIVASTTITNSPAQFPTNTHLADFNVQTPPVRGGEAWVGKPVGVQIASTVGFDRIGGYWDLDNVRLQVIRDPVLRGALVNGNQFQFTLLSAPGRYEVLSSTNVAGPPESWASLAMVTNLTGSLSGSDTNRGNRFYQVRPSP